MILDGEILLIGSGGQSRVVISILKALRVENIIGILDLGEPKPGELIMGIPVLGSVNLLGELIDPSNKSFILAIGDNLTRNLWWHRICEFGGKVPNLISPLASVDPSALLGNGNIICAKAFIGPEAILGNNNLVNTGAIIEHEVKIGSDCHFAPSSVVAGRSKVHSNCFIGAGAVVINGIEISSGVIVGAGSVVIRDVDIEGVTVMGVPARLKGDLLK